MATPVQKAIQKVAAASKEATAFTKQSNQAVVQSLPFANVQDFEDAKRGFMGSLPSGIVKRKENTGVLPAWNLDSYAFIKQDGKAPDTVNPSLWRQAQLNMHHGLFKVCDRVYQIRSLDLSNMTVIEGDTSLIIIDPLTCVETARASLELFYQHRPRKPVSTVMITHSHVDHFGGVRGVIDEKDVVSGKVQLIAPEGFLEHAVSENVVAGNAMRRRAQFMYGAFLPRGERGQVDAGLGKAVAAGVMSLIQPNTHISKTGDVRVIDGLKFEFQMANCTEAPVEMIIYLPDLRALCAAEVMTHNMHNLYTLRGAHIRDAVQWWKTIDETLRLFGDRTDVVFAQHHWPIWGSCKNFLSKQRDLYKYMHDQTVRLMNHGYTMLDIADKVQLPADLGDEWFNRGYYGSVSHNVRGIYQFYLGYYSSNPAELNPLPPVAAGKKYIEFMGGADKVLAMARECYAKGEYRWVAQVVNHVIFADPTNKAAIALQADTLEQLGYQSENATWRNEYLVAAMELRLGSPIPIKFGADDDMLRAMTLENVLDYVGVRLNADKAVGKVASVNVNLPARRPTDPAAFNIRIGNSVFGYRLEKDPAATAEITLALPALFALLFGAASGQDLIKAGKLKVTGDASQLDLIVSVMDTFSPDFNIVMPHHAPRTLPNMLTPPKPKL
ncbi:sterol-binding domain-containing protein [Gongronella butleri]|nr:sterol-binding domain-containing protein [Gongronella butleri]